MSGEWSKYIPEHQREQAEQLRRRLRRRSVLSQRGFWVKLCLGIYGGWCLALVLSGNVFTFGLALVPLVSIPAIGWLAWWLVYKEFHQ